MGGVERTAERGSRSPKSYSEMTDEAAMDGHVQVEFDETNPLVGPLEYVQNHAMVKKYQSTDQEQYSPKNPIRNLFRYHNTATKMVMMSYDFYILSVLHVILVIIFQLKGRIHDPRDEPSQLVSSPLSRWQKVTNDMLSVFTPLVVFVLVFYNNQAYSRYMEQFFISKKIEGRVKFITHRLRTFFSNHDRSPSSSEPFPGAEQTMRDILRTICVAHYCLFLCLPRYKKRKIHEWGWAYLLKYKLVTEEQCKRLTDKTGPEIMAEAHAFVMARLGQHVRRGDIDMGIYNNFENDMHDLIVFVGSITGYAENQVPFAYYHLMNLLTISELVLVAYALIFSNSYLTIPIYGLLCVALLGLRDLSINLADPFGVDDTDFQTLVPTAKCHTGSGEIVERDSDFGSALIAVPARPRESGSPLKYAISDLEPPENAVTAYGNPR